MTATAPSAESTQMAHTPDPPATAPPADAEALAPAATGGRIRAVLGDHPVLTVTATGMVTLLATLAVALLVLSFNRIHNRIDRLEDTMNTRFIAFEDTMNTRFAEQDAKIDGLDDRIDGLDAKIDEINLKLTALIAALNKTAEVDAAIEGRLLDSEPAAPDPGAAPR